MCKMFFVCIGTHMVLCLCVWLPEDKIWEPVLSIRYEVLGLDSGYQSRMVLLPTEASHRPGIYSVVFTRNQRKASIKEESDR